MPEFSNFEIMLIVFAVIAYLICGVMSFVRLVRKKVLKTDWDKENVFLGMLIAWPLFWAEEIYKRSIATFVDLIEK